MNKINMVYALVFLIAVIFLPVGCISASQGVPNKETNDQISRPPNDRSFIEIFSNAESIGTKKGAFTHDVSESVSEFISQCCTNEADILLLLKNNGFKISPNRTDSDKADIAQPYDERIVAQKEADRFLYVWKTYRVAVYLKNNRIVGVKAFVFQDGL